MTENRGFQIFDFGTTILSICSYFDNSHVSLGSFQIWNKLPIVDLCILRVQGQIIADLVLAKKVCRPA